MLGNRPYHAKPYQEKSLVIPRFTAIMNLEAEIVKVIDIIRQRMEKSNIDADKRLVMESLDELVGKGRIED